MTAPASEEQEVPKTLSSIPPREKRATRAIGKQPRATTFIRALLTVTCVMHAPVWAGMWFLFERYEIPYPLPLATAYTVLGCFLFVGRAKTLAPDRKRPSFLVRFVDVPYFVHWSAALFALIPSIVLFFWALGSAWVRGAPFVLPKEAFFSVYLTGLVVCGYGVLVRRKWFVVETVTLPVRGLPKAFDGYVIAHLSDLHIGSLTPKSWGKRWAQAANAKKPDMTVVTGDLVTSGTEFHEDIAEVVGELKAPDGVFVSMGNHDYFGEGEPLISLLEHRGARVLRNQGTLVSRGSDHVYLAAIDDTWTRRADLDKALGERPEGLVTILLAHDPEQFHAARKRDVALTLSGHTHGGQVGLPFFHRHVSLSHLTHHFHVGAYKKGDALLYVHPGLGTTGPPVRLGVAPAVVLITLRSA